MDRTRALLLGSCSAILIASVFTASHAFGYPPTEAPAASIKECKADFDKLTQEKACAQSTHEQTEIDCLLSNEAKLSASCKQAIKVQKKGWEGKKSSFSAVKQACAQEISSLQVEGKAQKAALVSFMMNRDKLSDGCKKSINDHIKKHAPGLRPL